jgi:hypothetical protein
MSWSRIIWIGRPSLIRCRWVLRPTVGRGCRRCWRQAMGCSRSTCCRWPGIGNGIQALRTLANRLVGILHGCLRTHTPYDEHLAWHNEPDKLSPAA